MIEESTVFILGAGASTRYNYPTGAGLKDFMTSKLFMELVPYFRKRYAFDLVRNEWIQRAEEFIETFRDTTCSIDLFLSRRQEFTEIGKLAILYSIFHFEQGSTFIGGSTKKEDWYKHLYERMTAAATKPGEITLNSNKISFITFNYDRSLEQFLYSRSVNSFGEKYSIEILRQLKTLPIIHVYGKVADLDWEEGSRFKLKYNANPDVIDFLTDARLENDSFGELRRHWKDRIFIIHEERDNYPQHIDEIREIIQKAERIYFLGFGFDDENMKILGFPGVLQKGQRTYATCRGKTLHEIGQVRAKYMSTPLIDSSHIHFENEYLKDSIYHEDSNCLTLLRNNL